MKKNFKYYVLCWLILLAVFNTVVFAVRAFIPGYYKVYDTRFWIAWGTIIAAFLVQLICAYVAFSNKNNEKFFLNIPLITESYTSLILLVIVGSGLMLIPDCPAWVAVIVCVVYFGFSVISLIKAKAAGEMVYDTGKNIKAQTFFIKSLAVDTENLMTDAQNDEVKKILKTICEEIRYSDPMSSGELASIEDRIKDKFAQLSRAVKSNDLDEIKSAADELVSLLESRNRKCRLLK